MASPRLRLRYTTDPGFALQPADDLSSLLLRRKLDDKLLTWVEVEDLPNDNLRSLFVTMRLPDALLETWTGTDEAYRQVGSAHVLVFTEYIGREERVRAALLPGLLVTCVPAHFEASETTASALSHKSGRASWNVESLLATLYHNVCATYTTMAQQVGAEVQALGELVLVLSATEETDLLWRAANVRALLMSLSESVFRKERLLQVMIMHSDSRRQKKIVQRTRNLLLQLRESVSLSHELLGNLPTTYLGRVSLVEAETSQHTAVVTRHLNSLYIMVLPLLVLQGCFTMNVTVPGQFVDNLDWFWGIVVGHLTLVLLVAVWLKWIRWF